MIMSLPTPELDPCAALASELQAHRRKHADLRAEALTVLCNVERLLGDIPRTNMASQLELVRAEVARGRRVVTEAYPYAAYAGALELARCSTCQQELGDDRVECQDPECPLCCHAY